MRKWKCHDPGTMIASGLWATASPSILWANPWVPWEHGMDASCDISLTLVYTGVLWAQGVEYWCAVEKWTSEHDAASPSLHRANAWIFGAQCIDGPWDICRSSWTTGILWPQGLEYRLAEWTWCCLHADKWRADLTQFANFALGVDAFCTGSLISSYPSLPSADVPSCIDTQSLRVNFQISR